MNIEFTNHGWEDFCYWLEYDKDLSIKIIELLKSIRQTPFDGLGKPEALRFDLKGFWSRRISSEHRLVYCITGKRGIDQKCIVIQCRFHYDDK
ncbi:MAG: Txe/YoeB family addiction module toxin [Saprospiraceae bacterium]